MQKRQTKPIYGGKSQGCVNAPGRARTLARAEVQRAGGRRATARRELASADHALRILPAPETDVFGP